jgi:hypothetical protein
MNIPLQFIPLSLPRPQRGALRTWTVAASVLLLRERVLVTMLPSLYFLSPLRSQFLALPQQLLNTDRRINHST